MVLFVLSRLTGLARQVIIGALFGTSPDYDAYVAAFRVPDTLFQLVAGGALVSALLPVYTTVRTREGEARGWQLASEVMTLVLLVLTLAAAITALLAHPLVQHVVAPRFSPQKQALTASLLRLLLVSNVIFGLSGVAMGLLNAHQHFFLPALAPVLYNLGIIGGAVVLAPRVGIHGLAVGVIAGAGLHFLVQVPGLHRVGIRYRPRVSLADPAVREVLRLMGPRVVGLAAVQVNFLIATILASGLTDGSLSALDYAFRIMLLPLGIFAQAVATAAFPTFAVQVARGNVPAMRGTLTALLRNVLFLTVPATVGLLLLSRPIIVVLLERNAFDARSTGLTSAALQAYAVGLCGHAVVELLARAFYSLHDTRTPVLIGVAAMVLNALLSLLWVGMWGHVGLALANSVATLLEAMALYGMLERRVAGLAGPEIRSSLARQGVAAGLMGGALWGITRVTTGWSAVWVSLLGIGLGGAVYLGVAVLLRSQEVEDVVRAIGERFRGRSAATNP